MKVVPLVLALALVPLTSCVREEGVTVVPPPVLAPLTYWVDVPTLSLPMTEGGMHPLTSEEKINHSLFGLSWEGLFALDETFQPQYQLCTGYTLLEDGLTWEFTLDSSAVFSDGTPLTPEAVVVSVEQARRSDSIYFTRLTEIRSVWVEPEREEPTVAIRLSTPNGALPSLLTFPILSLVGSHGTGPYVLGETALTLNEYWWEGKGRTPWLEEISLTFIPEAEGLIYSLDTGEISLVIADLTSPNALGYARDNLEIFDYPTTTMEYMGFNCNKGYCINPLIRQAISRVLDRESIAMALYSRHAVASPVPIHPDSPYYPQELASTLTYSPQVFDELMVQAGYEKNQEGVYADSRGQEVSLTLVVNSDNDFRATTAEYLATELTRMGLVIDLQRLAWGDYLTALSGGNFDIYLGATALTADFNLQTLLEGSLNYSRFRNTQTALLLDEFQKALDEERGGAGQALYENLAEEVPFTPLVFKNESLLSQWGILKNQTPTQQNPFYNIAFWMAGGASSVN